MPRPPVAGAGMKRDGGVCVYVFGFAPHSPMHGEWKRRTRVLLRGLAIFLTSLLTSSLTASSIGVIGMSLAFWIWALSLGTCTLLSVVR